MEVTDRIIRIKRIGDDIMKSTCSTCGRWIDVLKVKNNICPKCKGIHTIPEDEE